MNAANVRRIFRKELKETLRDRRTLLIMLVVPVFLYPVLMIVAQQLAIFGQRQLEEAPVEVYTQGAEPEAVLFLEAEAGLRVVPSDTISAQQVAAGAADLLVRFERGESERLTVVFDAANERSSRGRSLVRARLAEWGDSVLARRLAAEGLPASFATPVEVVDSSVASAERLGGYALGRFLPLLLILMTLLGAFYPAIDLSAGEKERGTLETLLTTPVPAGDLVAGKFLTVLLIALCTAALNLVSMLLTFRLALFQLGEAAELNVRLPAVSIVLIVLFIVPLAIFFSALFLGLALRAQSFKEAQNTLTPVQFASMIPMMLPLIPGISLTYAIALVPIGGVSLLFRDLMVGEVQPGPALLAIVTTVGCAGAALRFAAASFGREEVLFGTGGGASEPDTFGARVRAWRERRVTVPSPAESLTLIAIVALLYFYLGGILQVRGGEIGILLSQVALLAIPAVAFAWIGPYAPRETLALRRPSGRGMAAATLIILGGMPVGWLLGWVQSFVFEIPEEFVTALEELMRAETGREVVWLLLLVAVTPAICEELIFRGALLQGLLNGMTPARAIALSAVIFGAFHLSTATVIRFLPSAWLGLLLALVAYRTGSLAPAMLMHLVNNGLVVVLLAWPGAEAALFGGDGRPAWPLLAVGIPTLLLGLRLLPRRRSMVPPGTSPGQPASSSIT